MVCGISVRPPQNGRLLIGERLRQLPEDIRGILVVPDGSGTVAVAVAGAEDQQVAVAVASYRQWRSILPGAGDPR